MSCKVFQSVISDDFYHDKILIYSKVCIENLRDNFVLLESQAPWLLFLEECPFNVWDSSV